MARYKFNPSVALRDLYRLLCAFMSLEAVKSLHGGNSEDPLHQLQELYAQDEIVHLLISTATMQRVHSDSMRSYREDPGELWSQEPSRVCGELQVEDRHSEPLKLREACNKIIHATSIEIFDWANPVLRLEGTLGQRSWTAFVEINDYVRASVENLEDATA